MSLLLLLIVARNGSFINFCIYLSIVFHCNQVVEFVCRKKMHKLCKNVMLRKSQRYDLFGFSFQKDNTNKMTLRKFFVNANC